MLHRAITSGATRLQRGCGALVLRAQALTPLLLEFSLIVAAAALISTGYAMAMVWDRVSELARAA